MNQNNQIGKRPGSGWHSTDKDTWILIGKVGNILGVLGKVDNLWSGRVVSQPETKLRVKKSLQEAMMQLERSLGYLTKVGGRT